MPSEPVGRFTRETSEASADYGARGTPRTTSVRPACGAPMGPLYGNVPRVQGVEAVDSDAASALLAGRIRSSGRRFVSRSSPATMPRSVCWCRVGIRPGSVRAAAGAHWGSGRASTTAPATSRWCSRPAADDAIQSFRDRVSAEAENGGNPCHAPWFSLGLSLTSPYDVLRHTGRT